MLWLSVGYFRGHRARAGAANWEGDTAREIWGWGGVFRLGSRPDWERIRWGRGFSELPLASFGGLTGLRNDIAQEPGKRSEVGSVGISEPRARLPPQEES